jgi:hypothetical protein
MNDEFEGQPQVNPPDPSGAFASYMTSLGMSPGTTGTSAANPAVAQGGLANQQPGAGASVATQNQNYMQPYWLQQGRNPLSINTGSGSLIGGPSGGGGGGGCD